MLDPLGPYRDLPDWPPLLEHNPLETFPETPTAEDRDAYLGDIHERFAVTKTALRLAHDIQSMIRAGYRQRDPTKPENRRQLYKLAELSDTFDVSAPTFYANAFCLVLKAITGMGKSLTIKRILNSFSQVAVHGMNEGARWLKHTQVIHLTVKMADTGSRGGFIDAVLYALDNLLGTDYFNSYRGERTVDRRSLRVAQLLALHSVGLLVVEEMQPENFMEGRHKKELNVFFLSMLSFGVPLLLIGNPRAFERLSEHKQTERRYYSYEPITLWPCDSALDPDWANAIAPAIWHYQVVDQAEPYSQDVADALWECSGGVPGYAQQLVTEVQRSVLRRTEKALTVDAVKRHFRNLSSFRSYRGLIAGLVQKNPDLISGGKDIPVEAFRARWATKGDVDQPEEDSSNNKDTDENQLETGNWDDFKKRKKQQHKTKRTRAKNTAKKAKAMQTTLDDDDIRRRENLKESLSKTMDELKSANQSNKSKDSNGRNPKKRRT